MTQDKDLLVKQSEKLAEYTKIKNALRYRLLGLAAAQPEWYQAVNALEFGCLHHPGYRKDHITPSYMHQVQIASHLLTLGKYLLFPVRTIVAALLHDTPEDTAVSHEEIRERFGRDTEHDVELMTKEYRGKKKEPMQYFAEQADSPVASIAKGGDRCNNMGSMAGVFSFKKQVEYCDETRTFFFKMLKLARRAFPEQELAYENLKFTLMTQLRIFDSIHAQGFAA